MTGTRRGAGAQACARADGESVSARLGRFVATATWDDLPGAIVAQAKRSILNFVGTALGVATDPAVEAAVRVLAPLAGPGRATLIGRRERMDVASAAFVNAVAGNLLDFDDTHLRTVIHPSAPVAPPVLALAEERGRSGADAILAFALGAEVECRIGNGVSPGHYARGWHITATCGAFGAAAAAAKLLGLDAQRTAHALGIAASESAGLVESLSTAAKNVGVGNAARHGILAARFAAEGYAAAPRAIEGPLGWARAGGEQADVDEIVGALGERWELASNTFKPYPCGIVMHAVVDACLELRSRHALAADDVARVTVRGDALLLARGDRAVADERDARVSIHHAATAALLWGAAGVGEFSAERAMSPQAVAFRSRIVAERDDSLPVGAASVTVETASGERFETTVLHARGSAEQPLGDDEIDAKVRALAGGGACADVDALIAALRSLESQRDVAATMRLATPAAG